MIFPEFVEAVAEHLKPTGAKVVQKLEAAPGGAAWWLTFTKAGCLYRLRFDPHAATLTLEREQGSFVANSPSTWRFLDSRNPVDPGYETAMTPVEELLARFAPIPR